MPADIRAAANRLRAFQRQAAMTLDRREEGWRRLLLEVRRDLAGGNTDLSAAARGCSPTETARADHTALIQAISALRHSRGLHQTPWPVVSIDLEAPSFLAAVREVRIAYDALFACLDRLERRAAIVTLKEGLP